MLTTLMSDNQNSNVVSSTVEQIKFVLKTIQEIGFTDEVDIKFNQLVNSLPGDKTSIQKILKESLSPAEMNQFNVVAKFCQLQSNRRQEDARAVNVIFSWVADRSFNTIEANQHSRLHKLSDAFRDKTIYPTSVLTSKARRETITYILDKLPCFVVKHDWAAALDSIFDKNNGEVFRLPFPSCAFEFVIEGKCVVTIASEQENGEIKYLDFIEFEKDKWFQAAEDDEGMIKAFKAIRKQITAMCVGLGAQIAEYTEVPSAQALNKKRLKNGKTPLKDYHVVDLSTRFLEKAIRSSTPSLEHSERKSPRLHWRRGHWRHIQGQKPIYIEWMLVGNIDLGFIDKHYRI